jgi:rhodanese-related sulfurtransferase
VTRSIKSHVLATMAAAITLTFATTTHANEEPPCPFDESRSGLCGYYHSQISPSEAFLNAVVNRGNWTRPSERPVILDVRSTPEYKAGHPQHAYNVPYPFIYQHCEKRHPDGACASSGARISQDDTAFVTYVQSIVPDKHTPIYVLCRTGVRSVGASNLLTDAGYTNVRNIWEGFVGVYLTAPKVQEDGSTVVQSVDLNHDGILDDRDKNGWRYHQGLPYETRLLPHLIYRDMAHLYYWD